MKKLTPLEIEYKRQRRNLLRRINYARKKGYDVSESVIPKTPKKITESSLSRLQKITFSSLTKKSSTKATKKSSTKAPKKSSTKAPKKSSTKAPKKSSTKATKKSSTKATKKSSTKAPKKSSTKATKKSSSKGTKKTQKRSTKNGKAASAKYGENTGAIVSGMILDSIFSRIEAWSPALNWNKSLERIKTNDRSLLRNILNGLVSNLGADTVEKNLQANAEEVSRLVDEILCHYSGGKEFESGRQLVQFDISRFIALASGKTPPIEQSKSLDEYMTIKDDSLLDSAFGDVVDDDDFLTSLII